MADSDFAAALDRVVDALELAGVGYAVTGSFALAYYGLVRATHDIDFKVQLERSDEKSLLDAARALGPAFRAIDATTFRFRERVDVELYPLDGAIDRNAFRRRRRVKLLPGAAREYWIVSPEDLILSKLREIVRWRDLKHVEDVRALAVALRASLDWDYLDAGLAREGFERAWDEWIEPTDGPVRK